MDHDGTFRHGNHPPGGSYEQIVPPVVEGATAFGISLSDAAPQQSSIQRYSARNTANVADASGATNNFGDIHAAHTPGHAGRALPHCNRHPAPVALDTFQDGRGAAAAPGSANRVADRGESARGVALPGQRSQSVTDTTRIIRAARLRDLLASIEEFWRASGPDRVWWRRDALWRLREWRRLHAQPERAAFQATVSRTAQRRATA